MRLLCLWGLKLLIGAPSAGEFCEREPKELCRSNPCFAVVPGWFLGCVRVVRAVRCVDGTLAKLARWAHRELCDRLFRRSELAADGDSISNCRETLDGGTRARLGVRCRSVCPSEVVVVCCGLSSELRLFLAELAGHHVPFRVSGVVDDDGVRGAEPFERRVWVLTRDVLV